MRGSAEVQLVWRLLTYAVRHRPSIIPATLLGILSSMAEIVAMISIIPLGTLAAGGALSEHSPWHALATLLGTTPSARFFVILFLSTFLFRLASNVVALIFASHTMQMLFAHFASSAHAAFVRHLHFRDITRQQIGHFVAIAGDESNRGAQIVVGVMRIIPVVFLFAVYVVLLFVQSWQGGTVLVVLLLLLVLSMRGAFRKSLRLGRRIAEEARAVNNLFIDSLSGLRTVRGFTAENFVIRGYRSLIEKYVRTSFYADALSQLPQAPVIVLLGAALAYIVLFVDNSGLIGHLPLFFAGVMVFTRVMPMANYGLETAIRLTANLRAGSHINDMLTAIEDAGREDALESLPEGEPIRRIEFEAVDFRYSSDTPRILQDFSCVLEAGHSYALTGPSGAGKSSLVDLLLKFYGPDGGRIRVNGKDIASLSDHSLRKRIILAEQAVRIFHGSVLQNVQFDDPDASVRAEAALKLVGLAELLDSLPQGGHTMLTFQGGNFSGGQRQRVGIARALVRNADVLILDESTNALDQDTRVRIIDALLAEYKNRILVFITHDPYVMERVDQIVEMRPRLGPDEIPSGAGPELEATPL
jgi:ABC-type multidrug transport system fused ATPase/permease subunit